MFWGVKQKCSGSVRKVDGDHEIVVFCFISTRSLNMY